MRGIVMRHWTSATVAIMGLIGFVLGGFGLIGHLMHIINLYQWDGSVGMATNTAVAITSMGFALILVGFWIKKRDKIV